MSLASTPSFLTAVRTAVIEVAAEDWAAATVVFCTVTPSTTSATSGATLTCPTPETVTMWSGEVEAEGSAASALWPPKIGPTITPSSRPAAAVRAVTRPSVMGPAWREAIRSMPSAGAMAMLAGGVWSGVAFGDFVSGDFSFIVILLVPLGLRPFRPVRGGRRLRVARGSRSDRRSLARIGGVSTSEQNPWRRVSRRVAYENPWVELFHDEVVRPDGQPGIYGVVHFLNRAIGVVPLDETADAVLLVGQYRYTLDHYSLEIPEGGGPTDEDPEVAARCELAEETGSRGGTWRELCRAELSNSVTDEVTILFLATGLEAGPASPEGTEQLQLRWVPFTEAMAMIGRGEITDAMTILAMQAVSLERANGQTSNRAG